MYILDEQENRTERVAARFETAIKLLRVPKVSLALNVPRDGIIFPF